MKVDEEQSIVTDPLLLVKSIKSDSYGDGGLRGNFSWSRLLRSFVLFLSKTWNWIVYLIPDAPLYFRLDKGRQSAMGLRWPGHYFCQFEKRLPQPEIKPMRRMHLEIRFKPAWCFLDKNSIQRKLSRRGEKRVVAGREKSPSFAKISREVISNLASK